MNRLTDGSGALSADFGPDVGRLHDVERLWYAALAAGVYRAATPAALDLADLVVAEDRGVDVRALL
jgi:hypothetical protein